MAAEVEAALRSSLEGGVALVAVAGGPPDGNAGDSVAPVVGSIHACRRGIRALAHVLGELTVAVRPDWQGRGVGRALLERLLAVVRDERPEIQRVELMSRDSNAVAIGLYERVGFRREGRMRRRVRTAEGRLVADVPMAWLRGVRQRSVPPQARRVLAAVGATPGPAQPGLAGVDGGPGGWIAALDRGDGSTEVLFEERFAALGERTDLRLAVVDIPIGLLARGSRKADRAARNELGSRSSCVFDAPIRDLLEAKSRKEASDRRLQLERKGFSAQAWAIVEKVREVDAWMCGRPDPQGRVREGHPELTFALLNGSSPLMHAKRSPTGRQSRLQLLQAHFGGEVEAGLRKFPRMYPDVLDAFAMLWTARRVAAGVHLTLPHGEVEVDAFGLRAEMVV